MPAIARGSLVRVEILGVDGILKRRPAVVISITVHATRDEAIAVSAAELAAEGGGEIVVHDEDCRGSAAGVGCSCAPAVHLITSTGSA